MKAVIVSRHGERPVYGDFSEPQPAAGESRIAVSAAAISQLVKSWASGRHYSSSGEFPFVVGVDGVGRTDDGRRVYFVLPKAPNGSMAERTVVSSAQCIALPDDLDDVTAAAIANPGMSSWSPIRSAQHCRPAKPCWSTARPALRVASPCRSQNISAPGRSSPPAAIPKPWKRCRRLEPM
ncbi:hypothetical protein [Rhodopseudomonas sp. RCAM05734]|uniref:hypothetical protein n=1 Tax=Rhodopseudomonas sp. RCAM05734 TaxID=3457549 RepID=UPI004043F5D7